MARRYADRKVEELEELFERGKHEPRIVAELISELNYRSTPRALKLKNAVTQHRTLLERQPRYEVREEPLDTTYTPSSRPGNTFDAAFAHMEQPEQQRLTSLYESLRIKLLDLSKKNRMLNYTISARAKNQLQVVDEVLEEVYDQLVGNIALKIDPLPEPDLHPADEKTQEFVSALQHARVADIEYVDAVEKLATTGTEDDVAMERLERGLRDRLRATLGMSPRPKRAEVNRLEHARRLGINPANDLPPAASHTGHTNKALQTLKYPDELEATMERIAEQARLAEQEAGLSTLFLAFGFLEWYESDDSDKPYYAPLLLLPVRVTSAKIMGKPVFSVEATEETAEANISLQKFLEINYGRELPSFDVEEDEDDLTIEEYLEKVTQSVDGLKRWKVRRWLMLGHFAFSRIAIYEDTSPERWPHHPAAHTLIGPLLSGYEQGGDENGFSAPFDYDIENLEIERLAPILVQDADASQHSALIDVMKGKNLVIQGPPGTGKSQTITNVIANALAASKSVLFLAEKQAALEVVKRRLDRAGLGDFCLELHSDKSSPKAVIEGLAARAEMSRRGVIPAIEDPLWREARAQLNQYLDDLHSESADGETVFRLIWRALRMQTDNPETLQAMRGVEIPSDLIANVHKMPELIGRVEEYATTAEMFIDNYSAFHASPWSKTPPVELPPYEYDQLLDDLRTLADSARDLNDYPSQHGDIGLSDLADVAALVAAHADKPQNIPDGDLLVKVKDVDPDILTEALTLQATILDIRKSLEGFPPDMGVPMSALPVAMRLAEIIRDRDADVLPQELVRNIETRIVANHRFIELIDRMEPVFSVLGITKTDPVRQFRLACHFCAIARTIPEGQRGWLRQAVVDPARAMELSDAHKQLVSEERELLGIFSGSDRHSWPVLPELELAASVFESSGIGKLMQSVSGKRRAAAARLQAMGFSSPEAEAGQSLRKLIDFRKRVGRFEAAPNGEAIGSAWKGLDTPFASIDLALDIRKKVDACMAQVIGSHQGLKDRFFALMPDQLAVLASYSEIAEALATELGALPGEPESGIHLIQTLEKWSVSLEKALSADPDRILEPAIVPIKTLAAAGKLLAQLDAVSASLTATGIGEMITELVRDESDVERVKAVNEWLDWTDEYGLPESLRDRLESIDLRDAMLLMDRIVEDHQALDEAHDAAAEKARRYGMEALFSMPLPDLIAHCEALIAHQSELSDWQSLKRQRAVLESSGLRAFLNLADALDLGPRRLPSLLEAVIARCRVVASRRSSQHLALATGSELETKRRSFADRDRQKILDDRVTVKSKLLGRHPPAGNRNGPVRTFTEMSLIRHEIPKQRRFTPVRGLLTRAGHAIQELKPCFMMSPLSLAKFLPANSLQFDILVIDEASQMRPEDALGAMLRCRQIVVVGDRKQLPPTSFFERSDSATVSDDEEEDQIDDESILERCQKVFNEVRRLKWHYRSRCESLIRFSNENFYESTLITFPAAKPGAFSVDLLRANGTYQARRNLTEAERISEEAIEFMRHFALSDEESVPTLGIVAVNTDQRDLISETMRRLAANDELVDEYMLKTERKGEPLFVKNLENVQGDERDFIFISMTYGPEPGQTRVKQRFGPINAKTGHRRLNVLFSRARIRIALFTSFGSEDVKPTETSTEGVHVLKRYLEYAETRGKSAVESIGQDADSDFEVEVARRLRVRGYLVELQVGVTGYKIDIGVRNPDAPETFLAGVECDGARYHSSKSARDRDRLREEVLGGLGWKLVRVWSTDWFDNPDRETDKLVTRLEALRKQTPSIYQDYRLHGTYAAATTPVADDYKTPELVEQPLEVDAPVAAPAKPLEPVSQLDFDGLLEQVDDSAELLKSKGPLSEQDVLRALRTLRVTEVGKRMENWEPHRSILRDGMIETFIRQRITEPEHWFSRVPQYLRTGTDPREKKLFLDQICDIVGRMT
ncbi:DUF4011 domain-containing protein [Rhizobium redzepovicii]|uniref:DUF4011 domain-containing protein n=1 Tax=Rhizobium redzepovicii TaxID=2867518 RepID=A0AAW8NYR1_9HYPH|nr:DUF4011 domain-containing protein [Rhizobium redzepovicii]MDR9759430.1 DUF4011 domain-containing protein [Rhizobium redzepovicii]